jgi:sugar lactone lactonase YvrE
LVTVERLGVDAGVGPEDVAIDAQGRLYAGMVDGSIMRLQPDGSQPEVFASTGGRPLGLDFDADGNLIVADAYMGLLSVAPDGSITVLATEAGGIPMNFTNDVDVAADGAIYFSDSSSQSTFETALDEIFGNPGPYGRFLVYDPATGDTSVLLENLWFANGVAASSDGSFVLVNELTAARVTRYWLTGPKQGESDTFIDNLPGLPDGISFNGEDTFWVAIVSHGLVLGLDMNGNIVNKLALQSPTGDLYAWTASVEEHEGMLYVANLQDVAIGRISIIPAPLVEDFTNVFFMSLSSGLNMISLPLQPIAPYTARAFAEYISATMVIRYDEALRKFVGFTRDAPDDGFVIAGGQGYIVNTPTGGVIPFTGAAWTNNPIPPPIAAPPLGVSDSAWAFVVSGSVLDGDMMSASDGDYTAIVKSLRTGEIYSETVDSSGYFAAAWADLSRKAVIGTGDKVEVAVVDSSGSIVSGPFVHDITLDAIRDAVVNVHLKLGDIIPAESALLQNYPNPFNPETWIPYHLSVENSVSVKIYSVSGQLVRTLDMGHKDAGIYASRSKAAYWDGRNGAGEAVASGIYFYSIVAGDYTATRKMTVTK